MIQRTFVAEDGKDRRKARLSWYHPDDTVSYSQGLPAAQISAEYIMWLASYFEFALLLVWLNCGGNLKIARYLPLQCADSELCLCADGAKGLVQRWPPEGSGLLQALQHLSTSIYHSGCRFVT